MGDSHRREKAWNWKGKIFDKGGYILVNQPDHPNCNPNGYIREHRLIMEKLLGRLLARDETVHHINGIKDDNRPDNLKLYTSNSDHMKQEYAEGKLTGINGPWRKT
jgi:hypothetical protein